MLFEKHVEGDLPALIRTSQMRIDQSPAYPAAFEALFQQILLHPRMVHTPPLFHWGGVFSSNWRFERSRVFQGETERLLLESTEHEGKEKYKVLREAEKTAGICLENLRDWTYRLESTRVSPLHLRFALAQLLRIRGVRQQTAYLCVKDSENLHMRRAGALNAYQNYELGHQLWRPGSDPVLLRTLEETAHYEMAQEGEFQDQLNHAMQAPSFEDFYLSMLGKNEVWKLKPQDTPLPRWNVRQFLRIYSEEQSKE